MPCCISGVVSGLSPAPVLCSGVPARPLVKSKLTSYCFSDGPVTKCSTSPLDMVFPPKGNANCRSICSNTSSVPWPACLCLCFRTGNADGVSTAARRPEKVSKEGSLGLEPIEPNTPLSSSSVPFFFLPRGGGWTVSRSARTFVSTSSPAGTSSLVALSVS
uniref:Putative secreted protein n=1 Tax=Ixodes ricinus TaxID=34613 RepID=A0A6B0UXK8_IXORI